MKWKENFSQKLLFGNIFQFTKQPVILSSLRSCLKLYLFLLMKCDNCLSKQTIISHQGEDWNWFLIEINNHQHHLLFNYNFFYSSQHANNVRRAAEEYIVRRQARQKSMTRSMTTGLAGPILSMGTVHYLPAAKCGTFFARDNVSNFITWCRWVVNS